MACPSCWMTRKAAAAIAAIAVLAALGADAAFWAACGPAAPFSDTRALVSEVRGLAEASGGFCSVSYRELDRAGGISFDVDGDDDRTAASMIKLAVLAEVFDRVSQGTLSLDDALTLAPEDIVGGSGVVQKAAPGTSFTVDELAGHMIAQSDNVATNMLIGLVGMDAVNEEARKLGLRHTALRRLMMDEEVSARGIENTVSANDVAALLESVYRGTFYGPDLSERALGYLRGQSDPSGILAGLPAGTAFAHKTGDLERVQNDGGIVLCDDPYVLVVLVEGIENDDALDLMAAVAAAIEDSPLR